MIIDGCEYEYFTSWNEDGCEIITFITKDISDKVADNFIQLENENTPVYVECNEAGIVGTHIIYFVSIVKQIYGDLDKRNKTIITIGLINKEKETVYI